MRRNTPLSHRGTVAKVCSRLDDRCASFETAASRPPQDEGIFVSANNNIPHAEERPRGRVSKHAGCPMQRLFTALSGAFYSLATVPQRGRGPLRRLGLVEGEAAGLQPGCEADAFGGRRLARLVLRPSVEFGGAEAFRRALPVGDRMARVAPPVIAVDRRGEPALVITIDMD